MKHIIAILTAAAAVAFAQKAVTGEVVVNGTFILIVLAIYMLVRWALFDLEVYSGVE